MSEAPQNKRKYSETGITPTKMPAFKTNKILEDTECEETVAKLDTTFFGTLSTLVPKLLDQSSVKVTETDPQKLMKELFKKGVIDEEMMLTDANGTKVLLKNALLSIRDAEDMEAQPQYIPPISVQNAPELSIEQARVHQGPRGQAQQVRDQQ